VETVVLGRYRAAILSVVLVVVAQLVFAQGPPPRKGQKPPKGAGPVPAMGAGLAPSPAAAPRDWAPPDIDLEIPAVAPDVPCDLPRVLKGVTAAVKTTLENLEQFTANERIEHVEVNEQGKSRTRRSREFQYLVTFRELRPGHLIVEEYRDGIIGPQLFFSRVGSGDLPGLILIFHPFYADDFEMTCEGLGQLREQPVWQVHFQQRPGRPSRIYSLRANNRGFPVDLKGRAWISADNAQILRLETDMMAPIPEAKLERSHKIIEYAPVHFARYKMDLWLPESADIYMKYRGQRFQIRHRFSGHMLFSVDTKEQVRPPAPEKP
jgi:hypothetical protein